MNIFLDCGANLGQGYERLKSHGYIPMDTKIYMFEPLQNAYDYLIKQYPLATIIRKAVWNQNSEKQLFIEKATIKDIPDVGHATNILTPHPTACEWTTATIPTIDLAQVITTAPNDQILLKLDIEGAEYDVLDQIIATEAYKNIIWMNVEFHGYLFPTLKHKPDQSYVSFFLQKGIRMIEWCELQNRYLEIKE